MQLYREDLRTGELRPTTTIEWSAMKQDQKMWIQSEYRQNNDLVKQWITVPMNLWDYTYADANSRLNISINCQITNSMFIFLVYVEF